MSNDEYQAWLHTLDRTELYEVAFDYGCDPLNYESTEELIADIAFNMGI